MTKPDKILRYTIGDKVTVEGYRGECRVVVVNNFEYTLGIELPNNGRVTVTPDKVSKVEND